MWETSINSTGLYCLCFVIESNNCFITRKKPKNNTTKENQREGEIPFSPHLLSCKSYLLFHWRKEEPDRKNGEWVKHSQVSKCTPWHWITDLNPWHLSLACSNEKNLIGASLTLVGMPLFSQAQESQFFPDRSGQVFHSCLPSNVNTTGCNLSHGNTAQIPLQPLISAVVLCPGLQNSLFAVFPLQAIHGRMRDAMLAALFMQKAAVSFPYHLQHHSHQNYSISTGF